MPRKKGNKKRNNASLVEHPEQDRKRNHENPRSRPVHCPGEVTDKSGGAIATTPLAVPQTSMSSDKQSTTELNATDVKNVICSDQNIFHQTGQKKYVNQQCEMDETQIDLSTTAKTTRTAGGSILLNAIESASHDQADELLKGNHSFSQDELDKALISACQRGYKYIVQTLAGLGANVHYKDTHGNTPLLISAEKSFIDIVRTLIMRKADINACNSDGDTALILSIRSHGSTDIVAVLLEQDGINVNHQNLAGYTALMKAVEVKDIDTVNILLDNSIKLNDRASSDFNLKRALNQRLLLNKVVNKKGETVQDIAERRGLGNIFKVLKSREHTRDSLLVTAVDICDTESINILLDCHFSDLDERRRNVDEGFRRIFINFERKCQKTINTTEIAMITRCLRLGAKVRASSCSDSNPLSVAVKTGNYGLVKLLCKHLDKRKRRQSVKYNALKMALNCGHVELVQLLLRYQIDVNQSNYSGSLLDCALCNNNIECAKLLIQYGAKMDISSAIKSIVDHQVPAYINFLFEHYKEEIRIYVAANADHFNNLFILAVKGGNLEIIGGLLDIGADVNKENDKEEIAIAESKNIYVANFLINRGANVNHVTNCSFTPLFNVLNKGPNYTSSEVEIVKVLLNNGASLNARDRELTTPLMVAAAEYGSLSMLQILLDHGANVNDKDGRDRTALVHAIRRQCTESVSCLLKSAKDKNGFINSQDHKGLTALMHAAPCKNISIVNELIKHGTDVNIKNKSGHTALMHVFVLFNKPENDILKALVRAGSDVNCQNIYGLSPLMLASMKRNKDAMLILLDSGADVNAVSRKDNTKTALSILTKYSGSEIVICVNVLLDRGASLSNVKPGFFHKMIVQGEKEVIAKLIKCGLGPEDVEPGRVLLRYCQSGEAVTVSPLCAALIAGNVYMARYFIEHLFLTNSDVTSLVNNKVIKNILERNNHWECLTFLDEMSMQPLSLFCLTLVSVSSAVGTFPGRDNRVDVLPLPRTMKDKLLFKSMNVPDKHNDEEPINEDMTIGSIVDNIDFRNYIDPDNEYSYSCNRMTDWDADHWDTD